MNEKQVRKMLKGEINIPSQVSSCMPPEMRADYIERLGVLDGAARPSLQDRIDRLDAAGLRDARDRIIARLDRLSTGAR